MMPHVTEYDKKMIYKTKEWLYVGDDGLHHLKEDAPDEIRKHYEKMRELYKEF